MKWKKYTIETTAEAVDHISWMLAENGMSEEDFLAMLAGRGINTMKS